MNGDVSDELVVYVLAFHGPNVVLYGWYREKTQTKPLVQRLVVSIRLEQVHGRMGMAVDETRHQDVVLQNNLLLRRVLAAIFLRFTRAHQTNSRGKDLHDHLVLHHNGHVFHDYATGDDGNQPLRMDSQINEFQLRLRAISASYCHRKRSVLFEFGSAFLPFSMLWKSCLQASMV